VVWYFCDYANKFVHNRVVFNSSFQKHVLGGHMWLLQLIGLVCLVGTAAGLVWFYGEQWLERRAAQKATEDTLSTFEEELNESDIIESTPAVNKSAN
jgi:hypothetical protein